MEIKFTDMDIVDANICFSREYLTKARAVRDKDRMLKLLVLANQSINNAIKQIDGSIKINDKMFPQKKSVN
jgi:hypothetical protein